MPHQITVAELSIEPGDLQLLELLKTKSTGTPLNQYTQQGNLSKSALKKSTFTKELTILAAIYLVGGAFSLLTGISFILQSSYPDLARIAVADGVSDLIVGILNLISSRILSQDKIWGLWLYGVGILLSIALGLARGETLNFISLGFALLMFWQMFKMQKEWAIS